MDTTVKLPSGITSAEPLTPLQLNGIRLDVRHTVLTPDYLEHLDDNTQK